MKARTPVPAHVAAERVFDFDIYADRRSGQDQRILEAAPDVFWTPRNGGHWIVHRFDMIAAVVNDPDNFSCRETQVPQASSRTLLIPLNLDPPDNVPYRTALAPCFSPQAIQAREPQMRLHAIEVVAQVAGSGECDFARDIAAPYPVSIFMDMMGLPRDRLREFRVIAERYYAARIPKQQAQTDPLLIGIMTDLIDLRRGQPGNDVVSRLLASDVDGRKLVLGELLSICLLLFLAGMSTVTNVMTFAYGYLAEQGALQKRLARRTELIPNFVEESLRLHAVVNNVRVVAKDCERFGVTLRAGDMIACVLAMAGRDGRVNPDPNTFDLERARKRHLAFSAGPHACLGDHLARAELRILTEEWLKRVPRFHGVTDAGRAIRPGDVIAVSSLPLRWSSNSENSDERD